jgi:hypothetical protein
MADQLNMNGLSLNESKHANGMPNGRSTYIPPHLRAHGGGPPVALDGPAPPRPGLGGNAWGNDRYVQISSIIHNPSISAYADFAVL